jgi:dolichol-phosphate mannosyltransferase
MNRDELIRSLGWRWLRFAVVGAIGTLVQLGAVTVLVSMMDLDYLLATIVGVETAVIHNFFWHEKWTWADRTQPTRGCARRRLLQFILANGGVSTIGNSVVVYLMVEMVHLGPELANLAAIGACTFLNFGFSEFVIFNPRDISHGGG